MAAKIIHENDDLYSSELQEEDVVTFGFRISKTDRDEFVKMCESKGTSASKVLRNFTIRETARCKA